MQANEECCLRMHEVTVGDVREIEWNRKAVRSTCGKAVEEKLR